MKTIHEISRCEDFEEYKKMSEANFNLVLHPEARFAAEDFHDRLKIPFIELRRLYQIDKIGSQYQAFGAALGIEFHVEEQKKQAQEAIESFRKVCPEPVFAVGECANADPFELSLALVKYGFKVAEIYGTITGENFIYIRQLKKLSHADKDFFQYGTDDALLRSSGKWRDTDNRKGCLLLSSEHKRNPLE